MTPFREKPKYDIVLNIGYFPCLLSHPINDDTSSVYILLCNCIILFSKCIVTFHCLGLLGIIQELIITCLPQRTYLNPIF